jgi:cytochrome c-type biogenesis protein CcmH
VFTCRTTDFSCTYSPKLHREVLALKEQGMTAQQVLDAFVAKYGEKALMAPKPRGIVNLTGYFLPGAVILAAGAGLFALIARRKVAVAGGGAAAGLASEPPVANASPEEMERLRHALSQVDD